MVEIERLRAAAKEADAYAPTLTAAEITEVADELERLKVVVDKLLRAGWRGYE